MSALRKLATGRQILIVIMMIMVGRSWPLVCRDLDDEATDDSPLDGDVAAAANACRVVASTRRCRGAVEVCKGISHGEFGAQL